VERLRSENEAFRQSAGTQAVIERNAKIQDLEQRNQELRVQLTEVRKKLVDVEAGKEDIQRTLNQVRLNLHNLEGEVEQLKTETKHSAATRRNRFPTARYEGSCAGVHSRTKVSARIRGFGTNTGSESRLIKS
jgi:chromosome segregation ATPase